MIIDIEPYKQLAISLNGARLSSECMSAAGALLRLANAYGCLAAEHLRASHIVGIARRLVTCDHHETTGVFYELEEAVRALDRKKH